MPVAIVPVFGVNRRDVAECFSAFGPSYAVSQGVTRYLDIREGDEIDAAQLAKWVKQAAKLPGFLAR